MADDASEAGGAAGAAAGRPEAAPSVEERGFTISTQYVKDLSVENPNAPLIFLEMREGPAISVDLDVNVVRQRQRSFEVVLSIHIEAKAKIGGEEQTAFVVELEYGGLVSSNDEDTSEDRLQEALLIEAPRYLFPFARSVISAATRDAGFPPLLINPIDFRKLYQQQKQKGAEQSADTGDGAAEPDAGAEGGDGAAPDDERS